MGDFANNEKETGGPVHEGAAAKVGVSLATGALVAAVAAGVPVVPVEVDERRFRRGEARYQVADDSSVGMHGSVEEAAAAIVEAQEDLASAARSILVQEGRLIRESSGETGEPERTERLIVEAAAVVPADGDDAHAPAGQQLWSSIDRIAVASADFTMLGGYERDSR